MSERKFLGMGALIVLAAFFAGAFLVGGPGAHAQSGSFGSTSRVGLNPYAANGFTCRVTAATATTECQAAPAAGFKNYVTAVVLSNNVGTAQTLKIATGTGTNCGTGTADLTHAVQFGAAVGNFGQTFDTVPLNPPAAAAICVTPSAATSFSATIAGFTAR